MFQCSVGFSSQIFLSFQILTLLKKDVGNRLLLKHMNVAVLQFPVQTVSRGTAMQGKIFGEPVEVNQLCRLFIVVFDRGPKGWDPFDQKVVAHPSKMASFLGWEN